MRLLRIALVALWLAEASLPRASQATPQIEAYVSPVSVAQGDTIDVHVSLAASFVDLKIFREGIFADEYFSLTGVPVSVQAVPDSAWQGCGWSPTATIAVQPDWPSGMYVVELTSPGFWTGYASFTVREDDPGSTARILFQSAVTTWQAYNYWGGKCFYDVLSTNNERAHTISFERPSARSFGRGYIDDELHLVRWLESHGYAVEYCTNVDVHADPDLLGNYDLFIDAWHDEYWSKEMRDNLEGRIASGGNAAFFGGNTCWWQIRFSPGLDQIVCYKDAALDPLYGTQDSLVTVRWHEPPLNRPENTMTGVSFANGGAPTPAGLGYTVHRDDHWTLAGTGLVNGQEFGAAEGIVGGEVDGALFEWESGVPIVTGTDGTPLSFVILATAPGDRGHATMGIYEDVGTVFNAASLTWTLGLASHPAVQTIAANVFTALVDGDPFAPREGQVLLERVSWRSLGASTEFEWVFRNDSTAQASRLVSVSTTFRAFGAFAPAPTLSRSFEIPPLPAGGTWDTSLLVPADSLPAEAPRIPIDGGPVCQPNEFWRGTVCVEWTEAGVLGTGSAQQGRTPLPVAPGQAPSYAFLTVDCADVLGTSWTFGEICPGWTAQLLLDQSGSPGGPAPNPLPQGLFAGWIAVSADSSLEVWEQCELELALSCGPEAATLSLEASACASADPTHVETPAHWSTLLGDCSPNPTLGVTHVPFETSGHGKVRLEIVDVRGRLVDVLVDDALEPGQHLAIWNGRNGRGRRVAPGVYFVRLTAQHRSATSKVTLLRR